MDLRYFIPVLACAVLITGCNKEAGENQPPVINWVVGDIEEIHPTYFIKKGEVANYSLSHTVNVKVTDPDGQNDITDIYFTDEFGANFSIKYDDYNGYWDEAREFYSRGSYSSLTPDSVSLTGWTIFVEDSAGHIVQQEFTFPQPSLVTGSGEDFVYSSEYLGIEPNGIQALIAPLNLETSEINYASNQITIKYQREDAREVDTDMWFYDVNGDYLAYLPNEFKPALDDVGVATSFVITEGMIDFNEGTVFSDIHGFHWNSMDDLTASEEVVNYPSWWRYRTISKYFPLVDVSP